MRICLLVHELGRSGGVATILSHARALAARDGWDVRIAITDPRAGELPDESGGVPVAPLAEAARGPEVDCAIATWWATAGSLWEVPARRRAVFLQSLECRFYDERHFFERFGAEQVLTLPVGYVVVAGWMRDVLAELRPDARCDVVRNGIDKERFAARPRRSGGPLRVLVEGQPSLWFKGVPEALAAVRAMSEPAEATVVAPDPSAAADLEGARVVGGLDAAGMADLYAEHDVLLKLSRVESLGLAPIEALHVGLPAVVTPYTGHEEYLEHGRNGLVVGYDDLPGTARALDGLARDRDRLEALSAGALDSARGWPSAAEAAGELATVLEGIAAAPEPDAQAAVAHLQRAQRRWLELSREHVRQEEAAMLGVRGEVEWWRGALEQAGDRQQALQDALRDVEVQVADVYRQLGEVRSERAYRMAIAARRLVRRGR
ncbi:MAG TPA: glycosyltransferase family 4 protein [Thermoleophilaceae bacterium]